MFKKGDKVTKFFKWNDACDFHYVEATVYSCGKKQMVLTSDRTGEELGRNYRPNGKDSWSNEPYFVFSGTVQRLTDEEAVAFCTEKSLECKRMELDRIARQKAGGHYPDNEYWNTKLAELTARLEAAPVVKKH